MLAVQYVLVEGVLLCMPIVCECIIVIHSNVLNIPPLAILGLYVSTDNRHRAVSRSGSDAPGLATLSLLQVGP